MSASAKVDAEIVHAAMVARAAASAVEPGVEAPHDLGGIFETREFASVYMVAGYTQAPIRTVS